MRINRFNQSSSPFLLLLTMATLVSCRGKSDNNSEVIADTISVAHQEESGLSFSIGIPYETSNYGDELLMYSVTENIDSILILPTTGYFADYSSNNVTQFHTERDVYCSDFIENPKLQIHITNNSNETLSFNKLQVNVESSTLDTFPYLYIEELYSLRFGMQILNECWSNWGTMTIDYSFEKKGEPFNGKYKHTLKVPYFEDRAYIDFKQDIISDGLNYSKLEQYTTTGYFEEEYNYPIFGRSACQSDIQFAKINDEYDLSDVKLSEIAYPFEYSYGLDNVPFIFTRIHARLSFSNSKFTKKITGIIPITCFYPGGADDELVDKFDIELKPVGKNYSFDLPYIVTLKPGQSERVQLSIKCLKSSHHKMSLLLFNDMGEPYHSKPIRFYNINGRHSSYHVLKSYE